MHCNLLHLLLFCTSSLSGVCLHILLAASLAVSAPNSVSTQVVESLYGQDLDSGHHGSGFPLPPFRQQLLEAHLAATEGRKEGDGRKFTPEEAAYSEHKWNINNMPRCKVRNILLVAVACPTR